MSPGDRSAGKRDAGDVAGSAGSSWDVLVVGGGPGGISAALWTHRLGLRTLLLEARAALGGQVAELTGQVIDYPGFVVKRGLELVPHFVSHLETLGVTYRVGARVDRIVPGTDRHGLELQSGERLEARALILAPGAVRRRLGVPGEDRLWGRGAGDSPTRALEQVRGQAVMVVGGGDGALENALLLAEVCPEVLVVHRRGEFRARSEFIARVEAHPRVTCLMQTRVRALLGDQQLTEVVLETPGGPERRSVGWVFSKLGVVPCSAWLKEELALDDAGYIRVSGEQETRVEGIFAVGDVTNPLTSSIAHAVGQGMVAARTVLRRLSGR